MALVVLHSCVEKLRAFVVDRGLASVIGAKATEERRHAEKLITVMAKEGELDGDDRRK